MITIIIIMLIMKEERKPEYMEKKHPMTNFRKYHKQKP